MSYLRYVCLFAYSSVQHISCCVPYAASSSGLSNCPFLIATSVLSNVYSRGENVDKYSKSLCYNI